MTYKEFRNNLGKAGLTIHEFAELTKMNPNSITNCSARGSVPSHLAVIAALMGEMTEKKLNFRIVLGLINIQPKRPRGKKLAGKLAGSPSLPHTTSLTVEGN